MKKIINNMLTYNIFATPSWPPQFPPNNQCPQSLMSTNYTVVTTIYILYIRAKMTFFSGGKKLPKKNIFLLHISSSYAKILGETNFHAREIPRSG